MIEELEKNEIPEWLKDMSSDDIENKILPIKDILSNSFYYPASAFDGKPIRFFLGNFYSFIYADYSLSEEEFNNEIENRGFKGYKVLGKRSLNMKELIPNGWIPDFDELEYVRPILTSKPFASWIVFERKDEFNENHNPERFSLLYICGDGVATFQALYHSNQSKPDCVAIIQPGTGFGNNWTDFRDESKIFAKNVLGNKSGKPKYLINGGLGNRYDKPCWSEYSKLIKEMNIPANHHLTYSIWKQ